MGIFKRQLRGKQKSKFYWTKFRFNGQLVQQSTKCTTIAKAREFEAALKTQLNFGRISIDDLKSPAVETLNLSTAMNAYFDCLEVKESTRQRYDVASKAPIEFLQKGKIAVTSITNDDVKKFKAWRRKQFKKAPAKVLAVNPKARLKTIVRPATVNRELALLKNFFNYLLREGKISKNPVYDVSFLAEDNLQDRVIDKGEYQKYLAESSQPLRDIAEVIYEQGMRPSEVIALQDEHLNFELDRIRIVSGKTKAARRTLTMTRRTREILLKRFDARNGSYIFAGGREGQHKCAATGEKPIVKINAAHRAAIARAKVKFFRLYDLRHTFATEFIQAGGDLVTLAAVLGHANLQMVQRYAHPTEQHQADSIRKLELFRSGGAKILSFRQTA